MSKNQKTVFYFLFLKKRVNKMFSNNIFKLFLINF